METPSEHHETGSPEKADRAIAVPRCGSRRLVLSSVAVGLASAAVLVLPAWNPEEASAGNHPAAGVRKRKDQRRKKTRNERNRKARDRRNHKGDRKHDDDRPPQLGPRGIKMTVHNQTSTNFQIKYWLGSIGWEPQESDFPAQGTLFAGTEDLHLGIEFLTERNPFVWVENPVAGTPNTTYQYGGSMHFVGYLGGTVEINHGTLEVDAETVHRIPFTASRSFAIKVRREWDIPGFKVFTMTVVES